MVKKLETMEINLYATNQQAQNYRKKSAINTDYMKMEVFFL